MRTRSLLFASALVLASAAGTLALNGVPVTQAAEDAANGKAGQNVEQQSSIPGADRANDQDDRRTGNAGSDRDDVRRSEDRDDRRTGNANSERDDMRRGSDRDDRRTGNAGSDRDDMRRGGDRDDASASS